MSGLRLLLGCAAVVVASLASCSKSAAPFPRPTSVVLKSGLCDTISNTERCAQAIEAHQLRETSSVKRTERGICFAGSASCVAPDTATEFGDESRHYLGTLKKPPYHVLWAQYPEGNSILLVHRSTGRRLWVDAIPVPSPSGDLVAIASADLVAGYNPNRLSILEVRADSLVEQWSIQPEDWGPTSVRWVSGRRLEVQTIVLDTLGFTETEGNTLLVDRNENQWEVVPDKR